MVPPKTTLNGLFERNQGFDNQHPYDLPKQWTDKKAKLDLDTPYNFVCTADIIGGNSGSPILDRDAKVVGLVFDGNIESLPGNYWFDERVNRCVGVHTAGMLESLRVIYEEAALVQELSGGK
jgi:V8-like Glu-specific endopeptidase